MAGVEGPCEEMLGLRVGPNVQSHIRIIRLDLKTSMWEERFVSPRTVWGVPRA